jgi:hypothetical protein
LTIVTPSPLSRRPLRRRPRKLRVIALALARRRVLLTQAEEVSRSFRAAGHYNVLRGFSTRLAGCKASINMSTTKLIRFLDTGQWLNIYEAVAKGTGLRGRQLEREVLRQLGDFGPPRVSIDRLFHFPRNTHYAALNLGGPGPYARYDVCCAIFDLRHWPLRYTCFAGDSIQAGFDRAGQPTAADESLLERLAAGEDLCSLAVVQHAKSLADHGFCLDLGKVRRLIEGEDTMIELHLFGKVSRGQISEVRLPQAAYERLCELSRRLDRDPSSTAMEFDKVRIFRELLRRLDEYEIPLIVCGDS